MRGVLGFDGGATKTECVLLNEAGMVVASGRSGASNPGRIGCERATAAIVQAADYVISEAGTNRAGIMALCAGIAGTGAVEASNRMHGELAKVFPGVPIKVCTDLDIALAAAGERPAIVLIAGTGSAAVGSGPNGEIRRAGGLGPKLGDEGSAGHIGKQAIAAARLHRERTGNETPLGKQLLEQLGLIDWNDLENGPAAIDAAIDEAAYPRLFPAVAKAADAGDEMAREVLLDAAGDLALLVKALVQELGLGQVPFRLAPTGGMMGRSAYFDGQLQARLREVTPNAKLGPLPISPAHAAARMALELIRSAN
jgi:N-acetylglucosamine kinase